MLQVLTAVCVPQMGLHRLLLRAASYLPLGHVATGAGVRGTTLAIVVVGGAVVIRVVVAPIGV